MLPVFRPLKDRSVQIVWSGLCTSTIGEDLFRVASVWLAVEVAGNMAGLVTGVQYIAMLVAGLFGGVLFDRWRPDRAMIGSRAWSAAFALLPVIGFYFSGLSITLLIVSSVGLASLRMVFSPALQSAIPHLVHDRDSQQAINGLFDATYRIARLVGPMVAALLHIFLPVIHFLTATALGFVVSGWALYTARHRLTGGQTDPVRMKPGLKGAWEALTAGFRLMLSEPSMGAILIVNAVLNGPWMVALSLAIALIVTEYQPTFLGFGELAAYALVMGAYGVGDVSGNIVAASVRFRHPMSTMFLGYVVMGTGFSVLALAVWILPSDRLLPAHDGGRAAGRAGRAVLLRAHDHPHADRVPRPRHRPRLSPQAGGDGRRHDGVEPGRDMVLRADGRRGNAARLRALILATGIVGHFLCRRIERRDAAGAAAPSPVPGE